MGAFQNHCALLLLMAAVGATSQALAAGPGVTGCNPYPGPLDMSMPNVAYDNPAFITNNKQYPIQVFSLASPAPWAPGFICLRYELQNSGGETIPLVFWSLLDFWGGAVDLAPGERLVDAGDKLSRTPDAIRAPTKIRAFRTTEVSTIAWQTVEDYPKKAAASEITPYLHFERAAALDTVAARAIEERQIPDVEVAVIEPSGDPHAVPPPLGKTLMLPFGQVAISSGVYIAGNAADFKLARYAVSNSISIKLNSGVTSIQGFAPALIALQGTPLDKQTTAGFLQALKEARYPIPQLSDKLFFSSSKSAAEDQRLFIVEHPVTIKWTGPTGAGSICIKANLYSPYPVSVDQNYCVQ